MLPRPPRFKRAPRLTDDSADNSVGRRMLLAPPASVSNTRRVKHQEQQKAAARDEERARQKYETRAHQLAGMPKGRGNKELKRLVEGGSLKETEVEKMRRQRKAQLEAMPKGRGKKLEQALKSFSKSKRTS